MNAENRKVYNDLQTLDLFLNTNDGLDKIKTLLSQIKHNREKAETIEMVYAWGKIESRFNLLLEAITDVLESANKKASELGYRIIK